jgi:aryl-alcohol dehydrogenase-like predicted oxidoreductase
VVAGKVRYIGASNYTAARLAEALAIAAREGTASYVALQPHYNLVHRDEYEQELEPLCAREALSCIPYAALADGFLTGKYRPNQPLPDSVRVEDASVYLNGDGLAVLSALDVVSERHNVPAASIAIAWLNTRPTVAAPIASARTPQQLDALLTGAELSLETEDVALLDTASSRSAGAMS